MKKILLFSIAVLTACFAFTSCSDKKEDDSGRKEPEITYDVKLNATKALGLFYYEKTGDLTNFYVTLADIQIDGSADMPTFQSAGNAVLVNLFAKAEETGVLPVGTYNFTAGALGNPSDFSINDFSAYKVINAEGMIGEEFAFSKAVLKVTKTGNAYSFDLTGTLSDERTFQAVYQGEIVFDQYGNAPDDIFKPMDRNANMTFSGHSAGYYGQAADNVGRFSISLYEGEFMTDNSNILILELFSPITEDKMPADGRYEVAAAYGEPETYGAYQIQPGYAQMSTLQNKGSNLIQTRIENSDLKQYYGFVTSGEVIVQKGTDTYTITVNLVDKNGYTIKGTFSGALNVMDWSYSSTLTENLGVNLTGIPCFIEFYGSYFSGIGINDDTWVVTIFSETKPQSEALQLWLLAPQAGYNSGLPTGNFAVTTEPITGYSMCLPGERNDNGELVFSWWMKGIEGGLVKEHAPLSGGLIAVDKEGSNYTITLNSHDDAPTSHRITGSWTGVPTFTDMTQPQSSAPKKMHLSAKYPEMGFNRIPFTSNLR